MVRVGSGLEQACMSGIAGLTCCSTEMIAGTTSPDRITVMIPAFGPMPLSTTNFALCNQ